MSLHIYTKKTIPVDAIIIAKNKRFKTALMCAAKYNSLKVAKLLIEKGADVNTRSKDGWTALEIAIFNGFYEMVSLPVQHGAK